jgi:hypothetical protein
MVTPGEEEIFDIDDAFCTAYGGQQIAFWNAHEDERGFSPILIYHVASGTPVAVILRPPGRPREPRCGPSSSMSPGASASTGRRHGSSGAATATTAAMKRWNGRKTTVFGLAGNSVLDALVAGTANDLRLRHAAGTEEKLRCYANR